MEQHLEASALNATNRKNLSEFTAILNPKDNVATALTDIECGEYEYGDGKIIVKEKIPMGFKVALVVIKKGGTVIKYGYPIGAATAPIRAGELVHIHNLASMVNARPVQADN